MDTFRKEGQPDKRSVDPDFEVQEAPDYSETEQPTKASSQPETEKPTTAAPPSLKEDKETLAIEKPIQSLFSKEQPAQMTPVEEEIELPQRRWSKKQEKKMKKKARQKQFSSESPVYRPDSSQASAPVATQIPPPPLVKDQAHPKPGAMHTESVSVTAQTSSQTKERPVSTPAHPIPPSKGIAYVDQQNRLKITGGYRIYPGDLLKVGEQEFLVKESKRNLNTYYLAGAVSALLIVLLLAAIWPSNRASSGNVTGIVIEQDSRALVPGASVRIKELGMKLLTNELGFFNFQMVPQGTYTLEAVVPGYTIVSDQTTVTKKKTSNLALLVSPVATLSGQSDLEPAVENPAETDFRANQTDTRPGSFSLKATPSDALVLVDNQQVGKGSGTYRNIKAGTHSIRISKPGYRDYQRQVSIRPGQTASLQANLERMTGTESGLSTRSLDDYLTAAKSAYQSEDYSSAVRFYNQAAQMTGSRPEVYLGRGSAYSRMGNRDAASGDFLTAASVYLESERYSPAAEAYSYYLELNPNNDNIRYQRGRTYLLAGDYQQAAQDIEKFLQSSPKSLNALLDFGRANYFAGDYQKSVEAYLKARKLNSMDKRVQVGLAEAYMGAGDRKACKSSYDKFRELATYVDREKLKEDPEWKKVLDYLQIRED